METSSISLASIREAAVPRSGVVGNPYLAGGFLIGSSLLGLLVIIGAFLYNRRNLSLFKRSCIMSLSCREHRLIGVQVIHNSLMIVLTMDALNLIATLIYGAGIIAPYCHAIDCPLAYRIWFLSRWFGVIIHLVNASLCIYHLCQPLSVTRVRIAYALVCVVIIIIVPLFVNFYEMSIFTLAGFMFLFALAVIETSRALTSSPSTATLKKLIVAVAMCNFLVVYVPTFILQCLENTANSTDRQYYGTVYLNVLIFTNLHLIFDGLQCALVLKLPSGEEQQQQPQQELKQWEPQQQQQQQQWEPQQRQQWRQQQWQPQQQQQWEPQQRQQWRQQQWEPQQQQNLGSQNAGFTRSTNVYQ